MYKNIIAIVGVMQFACIVVLSSSILFIDQNDGRIYGPISLENTNTVRLASVAYKVIPVKESENALILKLKNVNVKQIAVTNASLLQFCELWTTLAAEKMDHPPGMVVSVDKEQNPLTIDFQDMSLYALLEYITECWSIDIDYDQEYGTIKLFDHSD